MPVTRYPSVRTLVLALALCCLAASSAMAVQLVATDGFVLTRFNSATPGTTTTVAVTGMQPGEVLVGIDYRPATGVLYGIGSLVHLYTLDPVTGIATAVGAGGAFPVTGTAAGMGFNAVPDRIRFVTNTDQNLRINPNDGTLSATDTALQYGAGDTNTGIDPNIVAAAYTNQYPGAVATTLYDLDSTVDVLAVQNPPNAGTLTTVGPLGIDLQDGGFDIDAASNIAYLAGIVGGSSSLYTVDLTTGAATLIGGIGAGATQYDSLAIVPAGTLVLSSATYSVNETGGTALITVNRIGGSTGAISATVTTSNLTATAGSDYTAVNQVINFADGVTTGSVNIPILDDAVFEGDETVSISLNTPTGGATIGAPSTAVLTIVDNELPPSADLSITKVRTGGSGSVLPNTQVSYLITVRNNGTAAATNVTVNDVLPAGSSFVSSTPSQGVCAGAAVVNCTLGGLANGASATIALTINAPAANGPFTNTATVTATEADPNPANNSSGAAITVSNVIPTLSEYALLMLAALLGAIGVFTIRGR